MTKGERDIAAWQARMAREAAGAGRREPKDFPVLRHGPISAVLGDGYGPPSRSGFAPPGPAEQRLAERKRQAGLARAAPREAELASYYGPPAERAAHRQLTTEANRRGTGASQTGPRGGQFRLTPGGSKVYITSGGKK